jgi:tRNA nucleotidyltransferase (CCA-adding enzyme)
VVNALPEQTPLRIPEPVARVALALRDAGRDAWVVGECLHALVRGETPLAWEVSSAAAASETLALFPTAVPTRLAEETVCVPTSVGPVDLSRFRDHRSLEGDLAHRDFTVHALALDPASGRLIDPSGGRRDARRGRLRAVGRAADRLAESPVRALRAVRLVAATGYSPDPELEAAIAAARSQLGGPPAVALRRELVRALLGVHPDLAIALLRRTGIEADWLPGARADAPAVVAALPAEPVPRLAAWLRDARARPLLRRLRFPAPLVRRVELLLRYHPLDRNVASLPDVSLRRLLRRLEPETWEQLFALREAELAAAPPAVAVDRAREALAGLRSRLERTRRRETQERQRDALALDGRAVMEVLGCGPGPRVGRALHFLAERALADPGRNTPEALRAELRAWAAKHPR